ncbi:pentatricopeptide repeat-containing protein [Canna indica]|uniref:Pentatricopeptide repeat-containing protein n=1 Tax=Canna indica TaxID=4628 RepID=A0AAQ3QRJ9_9LILI|nr:pentatricopeptide repeat-containing protein [Canna indica]
MRRLELGNARLPSTQRQRKLLSQIPPPTDLFSSTTTSSSCPSAPPPPPPALSPVQAPSVAAASAIVPLPSLLPLSLNPFNAVVDLITSRLKQQRQQHDDEGGEELLEANLLPFLRPQEVSRVLLRCQSLPLQSLRFFRWAQSRVLPSPHSFALLAHVLASSPTISVQALAVLSDLVRAYPRLDDAFDALVSAASHAAACHPPAAFGKLVKVYARFGRTQDALDCCRRVVALGFIPDTEVFNCLLHSLGKTGCLDRCWNLYDEMRKVGVPPNSYTFNILINALCRGGDGSGDIRAVDFLDEMESEGFDPDVVTYNTLIDGYCRRGKLDEAFHLFKIMYRRRVEPDLISYTTLMNGLCKDGKIVKARQLFDTMLHRGLCPDNYCYNVLLSGYCREGNLKELRLLVQEMISNGFLPDNFACGRMVEAHVKDGRLLPCLNLIALLQKVGVTISFDVYKFLLEALCSEGRPSAAKNLLKQMQLDGYEPNLEIYNLLIFSFCKYDSLESEGFHLKNEMVGKGVKPDLFTYAILIECLCKSGKTLEGECLMKEMIEADIQPDSRICAALVTGWCKKRDLCKAESLLVYFAENFQIYDSISYNSLIRLCFEVRGMSESLELQERLLKLGFIPNDETCRLFIHGLSNSKSDDVIKHNGKFINHAVKKWVECYEVDLKYAMVEILMLLFENEVEFNSKQKELITFKENLASFWDNLSP